MSCPQGRGLASLAKITVLLLFIPGATSEIHQAASTIDCWPQPTDHPIGVYLGPTKLTSSYYGADDKPVQVVEVDADLDWQARTLKRMLDGQRGCVELNNENNGDSSEGGYEDDGPCEDILPGFLASMIKLIEATSSQLQRPVQIGYVVVPHHLRDYIPFMDAAMHVGFNFSHNPRPDDDLIEYDVVELGVGAQYGYDFTDPLDRWGAPDAPDFDEGDYLLYVNVEDNFLEVGYKNIGFYGSAPFARRVVPMSGIKSSTLLVQQAADSAASQCSGPCPEPWSIRPPWTLEFGAIVDRIAQHIASFLSEVPVVNPDEDGDMRAVVLTGGASENLLAAASMALPYALPKADPTMFMTYMDPAFVPSLGAARMIRNVRVTERRDRERDFCWRA